MSKRKTLLIFGVGLLLSLPTTVNGETGVALCHDSLSDNRWETLAVPTGLSYKEKQKKPVSIYELPYSFTGNSYDWHRLWINTATLSGAFVGTLLVLECLPEDATSWNRAELQDVPLFKRWHNHVVKKAARSGITTNSISTISCIPTPERLILWRRVRVVSISGARRCMAR